MTLVAGIDYSMTSPALCIFDTDKGRYCFENVDAYFRSNLVRFDLFKEGNVNGENHKSFDCDMDRYDDISNWATSILEDRGAGKVFLEGY